MILEEGKREEFKRCLTEEVDIIPYPCGHVHIPVYNGDEVQEAIPLVCARCNPYNFFYTNHKWANAAITGVTCTDNIFTVDMQCQPVMPVEHINIQFMVNGDGVICDGVITANDR